MKFNFSLPMFPIDGMIPQNMFYFLGTTPARDGESKQNPRFRGILWYLVAGTRGGVNRAQILNLIRQTPTNANRIATILELDHKTVAHHLRILSKNELIVKDDKDYGAVYTQSQLLKDNQIILEEIMEKIGTKSGNIGGGPHD